MEFSNKTTENSIFPSGEPGFSRIVRVSGMFSIRYNYGIDNARLPHYRLFEWIRKLQLCNTCRSPTMIMKLRTRTIRLIKPTK
jgi:hypothetical protein